MNIQLLIEMTQADHIPEEGVENFVIKHTAGEGTRRLGLITQKNEAHLITADREFIYANGRPIHSIDPVTNQSYAEIRAFKRAVTAFREPDVELSDDWWDNL